MWSDIVIIFIICSIYIYIYIYIYRQHTCNMDIVNLVIMSSLYICYTGIMMTLAIVPAYIVGLHPVEGWTDIVYHM